MRTRWRILAGKCTIKGKCGIIGRIPMALQSIIWYLRFVPLALSVWMVPWPEDDTT
jgi:hypothetical protein